MFIGGIVAERVRPDGRQLTEIVRSVRKLILAACPRLQLVYAWRDLGYEYCNFGNRLVGLFN